MAFTPGSSNGTSNNTTLVDIVAAPAASTQRIVKSIVVYNNDSSAAIVRIFYNDNGTSREMVRQTVAVSGTLLFETPIILDTTTRKLQFRLNAAVAATQLDFVTNYADAT